MSDLNTPAVSIINNEPRTLSIDVAAYFGKRHDHVLRQIREIVANCPESFSAPNFGETYYADEQGKKQPCYSLTQDAFMLVVMGFTGHKAMQCKLAYIAEFNRMRAELAGKPPVLPERKPSLPDLPGRPLPKPEPPQTFSCPYAKQSSSPISFKNILSEEKRQLLEQRFEDYDRLRKELYVIVRDTAAMVGNCAAQLDVMSQKADKAGLHYLVKLLDPQKDARWVGLDKSVFNAVDLVMSRCRASVQLITTVQDFS